MILSHSQFQSFYQELWEKCEQDKNEAKEMLTIFIKQAQTEKSANYGKSCTSTVLLVMMFFLLQKHGDGIREAWVEFMEMGWAVGQDNRPIPPKFPL